MRIFRPTYPLLRPISLKINHIVFIASFLGQFLRFLFIFNNIQASATSKKNSFFDSLAPLPNCSGEPPFALSRNIASRDSILMRRSAGDEMGPPKAFVRR